MSNIVFFYFRRNIASLFNSSKYAEFLRFCIVGVIATAIHYGLYLLLMHVVGIDKAWWINLAYSIGYLAGFLCNLWLSAHFTFKVEVTAKRSIGFALSNVVNYGMHLLFLNLFIRFGISEQWAPIPVYCIVVPINFILVRFVFKKLK